MSGGERYHHQQTVPWHDDFGVLFAAARAGAQAAELTADRFSVRLEWEDSKVTYDAYDAYDALERAEERIAYQPPRALNIRVQSGSEGCRDTTDVRLDVGKAPLATDLIYLQAEGDDWPRTKRGETAALKVLIESHERAMSESGEVSVPEAREPNQGLVDHPPSPTRVAIARAWIEANQGLVAVIGIIVTLLVAVLIAVLTT